MATLNKKYYRIFFVFIFCLTALFITSNCFGRAGQFELNCPYWFMLFDSAGYMDLTYYYPSPRHQVGYHEMMTGDLAAAVFYQGISTGNQAAWLTDRFIIPDIYPTNSPFGFNEHSVSNTLCNPVWTDQDQPTGYIPGSNYYSGINRGINRGRLPIF